MTFYYTLKAFFVPECSSQKKSGCCPVTSKPTQPTTLKVCISPMQLIFWGSAVALLHSIFMNQIKL